MIQTGIITIGPLPASGAFQATAGPALREQAASHGWNVTAEAIVPDDFERVAGAVLDFAQQGCQLILTAGGTGISRHDVTPEAIRSVARMEIPGFGESMRMQSLALTPNAVLSRSLGAVVENSLVIALPGRAPAALECLAAVSEIIPRTVELLQRDA